MNSNFSFLRCGFSRIAQGLPLNVPIYSQQIIFLYVTKLVTSSVDMFVLLLMFKLSQKAIFVIYSVSTNVSSVSSIIDVRNIKNDSSPKYRKLHLKSNITTFSRSLYFNGNIIARIIFKRNPKQVASPDRTETKNHLFL